MIPRSEFRCKRFVLQICCERVSGLLQKHMNIRDEYSPHCQETGEILMRAGEWTARDQDQQIDHLPTASNLTLAYISAKAKLQPTDSRATSLLGSEESSGIQTPSGCRV